MDHSGIVSEWLIVSQVVGHTAGTVIMILLFVLVRRAARFDDPSPYGLLLWTVLIWNGANLICSISTLAGLPGSSQFMRVANAIAYTGAAFSPAGGLIMWRRTARQPSEIPQQPGARRRRSRLRNPVVAAWLVRASIVSGVILTVLMWQQVWNDPIIDGSMRHKQIWFWLGYHVATFFVLGALLFYEGHSGLVATRVAIGMTAVGALSVGITVLLQHPMPTDPRTFDFGVVLALWRQAATHLMTLGALIFLARFRFADVFVRDSLRMIVALILGAIGVIVLIALAVVLVSTGTPYPRPAAMAGGVLFIAALILSFVLIDRQLVAAVDRGLFRQPDYAAALRALRDDLSLRHADDSLHSSTARLVRETLDLRDARIIPIDALAPAQRGELAQLDAIDSADAPMLSLLTMRTTEGHEPLGPIVPVRTGGVVSAVLTVTPRPDHPTFLAREVEFLRAAATTLGHRLDVVHREREEIERRTHEAHLRQQLSEATLRALQAQVNPHFLFNTLNTIAHLIQADPASAEGMTLRLADVFSHVLTRSRRPFSSVREEMDFLRTYLTIEEARFGDRLRVAFAVEPAAEQASIPSLILQPAVENALKHGLAPKIGPGHLTISAMVEGPTLCLSVEDDGVGVNGRRTRDSGANGAAGANGASGVGLANIAQRLQTLYADNASLRFEPRVRGGTTVMLRLPLRPHEHHERA